MCGEFARIGRVCFGAGKFHVVAMALAALVTPACFADSPNAQTAHPNNATKVQVAKDWTIEIVPGPASHPQLTMNRVPAAKEKPEAKETVDAQAVDPVAYRAVYNSIPFRRSEYLANPDYRHEATMEILMGQLRPKTIVKHAAPSNTRVTYSRTTLRRQAYPYDIFPAWQFPMLNRTWW